VELLTFVLMFIAAWLLWRKPHRERLAFGLLVASILLMVFLFSLGTHTSLLPGVNY
jgi:chromate transport protein ChrA